MSEHICDEWCYRDCESEFDCPECGEELDEEGRCPDQESCGYTDLGGPSDDALRQTERRQLGISS